jgi:hypothetical protein
MKSFDVCDAKNDMVIVLGPEGTVKIPYQWGLAGRDGAWFRLQPPKGTSIEYIIEAKRCLYINRDVVTLTVERAVQS